MVTRLAVPSHFWEVFRAIGELRDSCSSPCVDSNDVRIVALRRFPISSAIPEIVFVNDRPMLMV